MTKGFTGNSTTGNIHKLRSRVSTLEVTGGGGGSSDLTDTKHGGDGISIVSGKINLADTVFKHLCVNRTKWLKIGGTGSTDDIRFVGAYVTHDPTYYYTPDYMIETFHYYGTDALVWYKIYMRGKIKKNYAGIATNDTFITVASDYRPKKESSYRVPLYDSDSKPSYRQGLTIKLTPSDGNMTTLNTEIQSYKGKSSSPYWETETHLIGSGSSNFDLSGVSWTTLGPSS